MFVYWGGLDGGKGHIRSFARLNSKTQVLWLPLHIKKLYTQNHINEDTWRDETYHQIIYHNMIEFGDLINSLTHRVASDQKNQVQRR